MKKNIISINNLSYNISNKPILSNISLNIEEGDFICILGPNGAGKTTFVKLITNLITPSSGSIYMYNKNITEYKKKDFAKNIAYIPQSFNIDYNFSVEDLILMGRIPYLPFFADYSYIDYQCAKNAMNALDILHLKNRNISTLSGGEIQRVFLARALAQEAKILVLDEAMSELDIGHQISTINILKKLNKEKNITIISVMHDINIASNFFNKSIIFNDGKLIGFNTTEKVLSSQLLKEVFDINAKVENKSIMLQTEL